MNVPLGPRPGGPHSPSRPVQALLNLRVAHPLAIFVDQFKSIWCELRSFTLPSMRILFPMLPVTVLPFCLSTSVCASSGVFFPVISHLPVAFAACARPVKQKKNRSATHARSEGTQADMLRMLFIRTGSIDDAPTAHAPNAARAAVITAGGRVDGEFARVLGTPVKALAPFRGTTFLNTTINTVRAAGIDRIAVVGGAEVRGACAGNDVRVIDESSDGAENLRRALHAWSADEPLLYLTSDLPFINVDALRSFLLQAPAGALALPLTEWQAFERRFPGAPPFGITLCGEKVVNGGVFTIPAHAQSRIEQFATRFFDARKSVWGMARLTGPLLLVQFALRRLSIAKLESTARRLLGTPALAVRGAPAELAYDVDALPEYRYAIDHA